MFERFTAGARGAVIAAQHEARELGHSPIGTEHVLIALIADAGTPVARLLAAHGLDAATARAEVQRHVGAANPDLSFADADDEDKAALRSIGIDLDAVRAAIEENFGAGSLRLPKETPKRKGFFGRFSATSGHLPFSPGAKKVLELSLREAINLGHNYIAPEHLMLGLLREGQGLGSLLLAEKGVDSGKLRADLRRSLDQKAA
jgi:ATP-dependent Clp protease ATP-binding subunit ClpA